MRYLRARTIVRETRLTAVCKLALPRIIRTHGYTPKHVQACTCTATTEAWDESKLMRIITRILWVVRVGEWAGVQDTSLNKCSAFPSSIDSLLCDFSRCALPMGVRVLKWFRRICRALVGIANVSRRSTECYGFYTFTSVKFSVQPNFFVSMYVR